MIDRVSFALVKFIDCAGSEFIEIPLETTVPAAVVVQFGWLVRFSKYVKLGGFAIWSTFIKLLETGIRLAIELLT